MRQDPQEKEILKKERSEIEKLIVDCDRILKKSGKKDDSTRAMLFGLRQELRNDDEGNSEYKTQILDLVKEKITALGEEFNDNIMSRFRSLEDQIKASKYELLKENIVDKLVQKLTDLEKEGQNEKSNENEKFEEMVFAAR